MIKTCKQCLREFNAPRSSAKYCSHECHWPNNRVPYVQPSKTMAEQVGRFWGLVAKGDGCWQWLGAHDRNGYGVFRFSLSPYQRSREQAHRWAYRLTVSEIEAGKELDHLCRNHGCVNPSHLEAVTHRVNILRGNTVAARNAAKTHCKYSHPLSGSNLYVDARGARGCWVCRRRRENQRKQTSDNDALNRVRQEPQ